MRLSYQLNIAWLLWITIIDIIVALIYLPSGIGDSALSVLTANLLMYAGTLMFAVNMDA